MCWQVKPYGLRKAFTLVELLVVISVIAMLLAILMPSLQKARDAAKAVICGSNLAQIGLCNELYSADNDGYYPPYLSGTFPAPPTPPHWYPSYRRYPLFTAFFKSGSYADIFRDFDGLLSRYMRASKVNSISQCPSLTQDKAIATTWSGSQSVTLYRYMSYAMNMEFGGWNTNGIQNQGLPVKVTQIKNPGTIVAWSDGSGAYPCLLPPECIDGSGNKLSFEDSPSRYSMLSTGHYAYTPYGRHSNDKANFLFCDGHVTKVHEHKYFKSGYFDIKGVGYDH